MKTVHNYCHVERRADVAGVVQVERPPATVETPPATAPPPATPHRAGGTTRSSRSSVGPRLEPALLVST